MYSVDSSKFLTFVAGTKYDSRGSQPLATRCHLEKDWERTLRQPPQRELGRFPQLELDEDANWARREFLRSDLPDGRLRARLEQMGQAWERHAGAPLPAIFPREAQRRAAVRLLHNGRVGAQDILQPHREALLERVQVERTVLLVQDTTTLNYTNLKDCAAGLGPLKKRSESARGLFVHAAVGFTEGGRPLGVSGLEQWARPQRDPGKKAEEEKESRRWFRGFEQGRELGRRSAGTRVVVGTGRATSSRCSSGRRSGRGRRGCWCG